MVRIIRVLAVVALLTSTYAIVRTPFFLGRPITLDVERALWSALSYAIGLALAILVLSFHDNTEGYLANRGIRFVAVLTAIVYGFYLVQSIFGVVPSPGHNEGAFTYTPVTLTSAIAVYVLELLLATLALLGLRRRHVA